VQLPGLWCVCAGRAGDRGRNCGWLQRSSTRSAHRAC